MNTDLPVMPIGMLPMGTREPRRVPPPPMSIRLPADLLVHLRAAAGASCRSLNKEIEYRLQASAEGESVGEHGVIVRRVQRLAK